MRIVVTAETHITVSKGAAMDWRVEHDPRSESFRDSEGLRIVLQRLQSDGGSGWRNDLEAARVIEMRGQLGRFVSMDELLAYVDLPESTATRLRDVAVFV